MKKTGKNELTEKMVFDNYAYAKGIYDGSKSKLKRVRIGMIISAISSAFSVCAVAFGNQNDELLGLFASLAFVGSIASYILGGGFKRTLRAAKKLAFFGWLILPFPYDLATGLVTITIAPIVLFFFPVFFVFGNYRQIRHEYKDAEEYINCYRPAEIVLDRVG